jgi:hypothetical protein
VPEHVVEYTRVEAAVYLARYGEQFCVGEPSAQRVNVDEVASCGAIEQSDDLAAGEFVRRKCRSSDARARGSPRRRVQREIDKQVLGSVDEQWAGARIGPNARANLLGPNFGLIRSVSLWFGANAARDARSAAALVSCDGWCARSRRR